MTRKKDRFDKKADHLRLEHIGNPWLKQVPDHCWPSLQFYIARMVRAENAWMRRMVKEEADKVANDKGLSGDGDLTENILTRLTQRRG